MVRVLSGRRHSDTVFLQKSPEPILIKVGFSSNLVDGGVGAIEDRVTKRLVVMSCMIGDAIRTEGVVEQGF